MSYKSSANSNVHGRKLSQSGISEAQAENRAARAEAAAQAAKMDAASRNQKAAKGGFPRQGR